MSNSFSRFMEEYNADGIKKLDGYTLSLFSNFNDTEKQKAFDLLSDELISHPPAVLAMSCIDPQKTISVIENIRKKEIELSNEILCEAYKVTNKKEYLTEIFNKRNTLKNNDLIPYYVNLCELIEIDEVNSFIKKAILEESNSTVLSITSRALLKKNGYQIDQKNDEFKSKIHILKKGNTKEKKAVLNNL